MSDIFKKSVWPLSILLLGIVTYLPLIIFKSPVNPDAQFIIPILIKTHSIGEYFNLLTSWMTLDFQPVRDLSLLIDLKVFEYFGLNISVFHNLLLWVISSIAVGRLLKKIFPELSDLEINLICACIVVYPLFTQAISWGVARKHILAFLFCTLATLKWVRPKSNSISATLFYFLAVLSQPIALLWPIWALSYEYFITDKNQQKRYAQLVPAFLILCVVGYVNYLYYETSPLFAQLYGTKTNELLEISDKVLAVGHYIFQMFFPYLLSFIYTLGHWSTLVGLILLGAFSYLLLGLKINRRFAFVWGLYIFLPLSIVITKSRVLYDTYLLIPVMGALILVIAIKLKLPDFKFKNHAYIFLIIFWAAFSYSEASGWKNEIQLTQRSFERRPTCLSAFQYLRMSYENDLPPESPEARKFLYNNECEAFEMGGQDLLNLQAYILYYEADFPLEERIIKMQNIASKGIFPNMALAALYLKSQRPADATNTINQLISTWGDHKFRDEFIPIAFKLKPFCEETKNSECLRVLQPFVSKKEGLSYK